MIAAYIPIIKEELLVIYNEENAALNSKFRGGCNKVTNMLRRVDKPISAKLNLKQTVISTVDNYILMIMPFFFRYFLTLSTVDFS